jgi:predicted nucleic acid-binding protein
VKQVILLDSGPLGLITSPKGGFLAQQCLLWYTQQATAGSQIYIPEIIDYELRRELLRGNKFNGLKKLDALIADHDYLPLNSIAMRFAAEA